MARETAHDHDLTSDTPLIHFHLNSLKADSALDWLKLSEGQYWLKIGEVELFKFKESNIVDTLIHHTNTSYLDYFVLQLHNNLIEMLPNVLEPIPEDVAELIATKDAEIRFNEAIDRVFDSFSNDEDWSTGEWDLFNSAVEWWSARKFDMSYFTVKPVLRIWRVAETIHLRWSANKDNDNDTEIWTTDFFETAFYLGTFLFQVFRFDSEFLTQMRGRVEIVTAAEEHQNLSSQVDILNIWAEQTKHEQELFAAMLAGPQVTDWELVRAGIRRFYPLH